MQFTQLAPMSKREIMHLRKCSDDTSFRIFLFSGRLLPVLDDLVFGCLDTHGVSIDLVTVPVRSHPLGVWNFQPNDPTEVGLVIWIVVGTNIRMLQSLGGSQSFLWTPLE